MRQVIDATNDPPLEELISKTIHIITGGVPESVSQAFWKAKARWISFEEPRNKRLQKDEVITFSEADVVPNQTPHADVLGIKIIITSIR